MIVFEERSVFLDEYIDINKCGLSYSGGSQDKEYVYKYNFKITRTATQHRWSNIYLHYIIDHNPRSTS